MNRAAGLATAEAGDTIIVRAANGTAMDLLITGAPVDSGTYYTIPVSVTTGTVTKGARTQIGILSPTPHGIPAGGTDGQVLTKTSSTDYAVDWETPSGGGGGISTEDAVDAVAAALVAGNNIDIAYVDASNTITIDVEALAIADVSGLQTALDAKETPAGAQTKVDTHVNDTTAAHAATAIGYAGSTSLSATTVEAALDELDAEKQPLDADLTTIAGLTATTDNVIQSVQPRRGRRAPRPSSRRHSP